MENFDPLIVMPMQKGGVKTDGLCLLSSLESHQGLVKNKRQFTAKSGHAACEAGSRQGTWLGVKYSQLLHF